MRLAGALGGHHAPVPAARYIAIIESSRDGFVGMDEHGVITDWNQQSEIIFGYPRDEAIGSDLADLIIPEELRAAHRLGIERFLATGEGPVIDQRIEVEARRKDGRRIPIELAISAVRIDASYSFFAFLHDITDRLRLERYRRTQIDVAGVLASGGLHDDVLQGLLRATGTQMGWEIGTLWTFDETGRYLRCGSAWVADGIDGADFVEQSRELELRAGVGLPGRVVASSEPAWVENLFDDTNFPRSGAARTAGMRSGVAIPIMVESSVIGAMDFYRSEVTPPDAPQIAMLQWVGVLVGQYLERERVMRSLVMRRAELKQVNEQLELFVGTAAHEMRTPLVAIRNFADVTLDHWSSVSDEDKRARLQIIREQSGRLLRLVSDLLMAARFHAGAPLGAVQLVDVNDIVRQVIAELGLAEVEIGHEMAGAVHVRIAPDHLKQIVINLLTNARIHGESPVKVVVRSDGALVSLEFVDHGAGVPAEATHLLFERFSQIGPRSSEGSGLGLSVVRSIARLHGGDARYEPNRPRGSRFVVTFPAA